MLYRELGKTGIKLTAITFGAWAIGGWMWGGNNEKDSIDAINKSFDLGITTIDTAPVYGFGLSETLVGKAIKGRRDKFQILTKCGIRWDIKNDNIHLETKDNNGNPLTLYKNSNKKSMIEECERSLKLLNTDYIDLYQIHWHDKTTPVEESMEAFSILLKHGKIRSGGVCNYSLENLIKAKEYFDIASNQIPYSMINRKFEADVIPYCLKNNIGILAYSPLQRGFLTGKIKEGYKFSEDDNRINSIYNNSENIKKINELTDKLKVIADKNNQTTAQLVINWTIQRRGITIALVGARNEKQAEENARSLDIEINKIDIDKINDLIKDFNI